MSYPEPPPRIIEDEHPVRRALKEKRLFAGVAVACVAGLAFGLLMKPGPGDETPAARANARVVEIPKEPGIDIVIDPRRIEAPLPVGTTRMEAPVFERPEFPMVRATAPRVAASEPVRPAVLREPPAPRVQMARPSFNCRYAQTVSEQMICGDPELAAADRRLALAYARAVRSGVPHRVLRGQQDVWMQAREQAAYDDPAAVAEVYEIRIAELEDMAGY